jgi:hypothetical protein
MSFGSSACDCGIGHVTPVSGVEEKGGRVTVVTQAMRY